jgi:hypothetical protein
LVWEDRTPGDPEIYYTKSTDGGVSWIPNNRLTWTSGGSYDPAISVDSSGNLHLVYSDGTIGKPKIYYKRSTDGGTTWTSDRRLTWTTGGSYLPALCVDSSDNLHLVYSDSTPGNPEIYYKKSTDGGATWTGNKRLTWTWRDSEYLTIAADSSEGLHITWMEWHNDSPFYAQVYYKKSTDGGINWTSIKRISFTSGYSYNPVIVADSSGNLHLVWHDDTTGNWEILYRKSTDRGTSWTPTKRLSWTSGGSGYPVIATDSEGAIHVVCEDYKDNAEIYYRRSIDGGLTWSTPKRLTWNSGASFEPTISVDSSDNLHLAWYDWTPGNQEIYYMKFVK